MLDKGIQESRFDFSASTINKEILEMEGFIPEEEARILIYRFLRANINIASDLLLGVTLFPFQSILIKSMLIGDFSMFVLSRGMSKTFSAAVFVMLQLIFKQGIKIGVLSSGFRQAKMIFGKVEDILRKPKALLARSLFGDGKKRPIKKGTDQWTLTCGQSEAIALPLADGSRLRGFRFSVLLLDEFLNIPKSIFQEVILPFLGVVDNPDERTKLLEIEDRLIAKGKLKEEDRYKWPSNKLILLSSPSYTFEYMYEVYCLYRDRILGVADEKDYGDDSLVDADDYSIIIQLSYDLAPPMLYDKRQLKQAKQTMSDAVFSREYGGQFISESDSYFRLSKMRDCTVDAKQSPHSCIVGNPDKKYSVAIDPSWSQEVSSDDFAISVFELDEENQKDCLVHAYGISGQPTRNHIEYFLYILQNFNVEIVTMDHAGGTQFVQTCNESQIFIDAGIELGVVNEFIKDDFMKPEQYHEDLIGLKDNLDPDKWNICYLRTFTSHWIREANELLQAHIDRKKIRFANTYLTDEAFNNQINASIGVDKLKWSLHYKHDSSEAKNMVEFLDHQHFMLELTKQETANIEIKTSPQGHQTFQLPQHMQRQTGENRPRKDNYSTLVLGNWINKVYHDAMVVEPPKKPTATFRPMML